MTVVFTRGVPWLDRALSAAERHGIADAVSQLVIDYRGGDVPMTAMPGVREIRLVRDGVTALVSHTGVVFGFEQAGPETHAPKPPNATSTPKRGRKAYRRGPKDFSELRAWLEAEGYRYEKADSGHWKITRPDGSYMATVGATESDHRSFANSVQSLRRLTGLTLRV